MKILNILELTVCLPFFLGITSMIYPSQVKQKKTITVFYLLLGYLTYSVLINCRELK